MRKESKSNNIKSDMSKKLELEALLFQYGEPLSIKRISKILSIGEKECRVVLDEWAGDLMSNSDRGLMLLLKDDSVQLVTKPEFKAITQKLLQDELKEELSPASLETLAVIAYLGPVPRSNVDYIRGVNSSFTLRNLLIRGLVERTQGNRGNTYNYQVTFDFLKHIGMGKIDQLSEYEKYKNILKGFETQTNTQNI